MSKQKTPDDKALFREMMEDVRPLNSEPRVSPTPQRPKTRTRQEPPPSPASTPYAERELAAPVDAHAQLQFSRGGIQHSLMKQLKRGELPPQAKLDLHGLTIAEAGQALAGFLEASQQLGRRCVLVVHGKGSRSTDGKPRLKTQVNQWLRDDPAVLAFCSAQPRHGGSGALYVLLKQKRELP